MSDSVEVLFKLSRVSLTMNTRGATVPVLRNIDLHIRAHERVAILGANGAGKSSLLRVMHGLISPTEGEVAMPAPQAQSMIFQRPLHLKRSALANVAFALRERGASDAVATQHARDALAACGIEALAERYARSLSGGEQQILALARAWALAPRALLADEPTASLAPAAVHAVEEILIALSARTATLVFSTHNRGQAKRLSTRVVFMHLGRIVADQPTEQFFDAPESAEAAEYLAVERV